MDRQPLQLTTWPLGAPAATECGLGFPPLGARTPGMVLGARPLAVMRAADGNQIDELISRRIAEFT